MVTLICGDGVHEYKRLEVSDEVAFEVLEELNAKAYTATAGNVGWYIAGSAEEGAVMAYEARNNL